MKRFLSCLLAVCFLLSCFGTIALASTPKPVTLKILADATALTEDMFAALFAGFEAKYPNVTLETVVERDVNTKFAVLIAGGMEPNVFYVPFNIIPLVEEGRIMILNDLFTKPALDEEGTVGDQMISGSTEAMTYKGQAIGIPETPGFTGVVVNESMFEEHGWKIPTNWEELIAVSREITAAGITPIAYGALGLENRLEACFMTNAQYEVGGDQFLIDLDNMVPGVWGSENQVKSLQMLKDLVTNGVIDQKGLGMDCPQSQVAFLQGKYAMCLSGFWFEMEMTDQIPEGMKLGYIAFPANHEGEKQQVLNSWFNCWSAFETSDLDVREATENFLKYIVSYEFQKKLATDGKLSLVINRKVMNEMSSDPNTTYFTQAVAKCLADTNVKAVITKYTGWYFQSFRAPSYIDVLSTVVAGTATPEQAAAACEALAEKLRKDDAIVKQTR